MKKALFIILVLISLGFIAFQMLNQVVADYLGLNPKSGIKIISTPLGAEVLIDGVSKGNTPFENKDLKAGEYLFSVQTPDATWSGKIKLNKGTLTIIYRDLSKDPTSSAGEVLTLEEGKGITVISSASSADVEMDGKPIGKTPLLTDASVGEHNFVISSPSFLKRSIKAVVPEGFRLILNVDLALSEADLTQINTLPTVEVKLLVKPTPTGFLRIRDQASTTSKEVTKVSPGDELILLEEGASWDRVRTSDGKEGYVSVAYVTKKPTPTP